MAVEIEAKMRARDPDQLRRRLRAAGAQSEYEILEINRFFDTPDRALLSRDCGLRIRTTSGMWQKPARHVITYKGHRQPGKLKRREEIEFEVSDAESATALMRNLGYHPDLAFEKRRQAWSLDDCEVVLDELPLIGWFIEVEGPGTEAVEAVRAKLGLAGEPLISDSYAAMIDAAVRERGIADRFVRFEGSTAG